MNLKTVFDVAHQGYAYWSIPAYGLLFVALGALMVYRPETMLTDHPWGLRGKARLYFSRFFFFGAIAWTVLVTLTLCGEYSFYIYELRNGWCNVVEGLVTDYDPLPADGKGYESFSVHGRRFKYTDADGGAEFHTTATYGGPIRAGLFVRIKYDDGLILRLQVAQ